MKKIWVLFLVISLVLPLHGMQLQLQGAETVVEKVVQDIPTLQNLCFENIAEKTILLALEQKLKETDYDFAVSRRCVEPILSSVSNGVNNEYERKIKKLFCRGYDELVLHQELIHSDEVMSAVFSPDGKKIALASQGRKVRIWDVATGACDKKLSHGAAVYSVAFSPDGKKIVSGGLDENVRIWDAATGACDKELSHGTAVYSVAFSPDGKKIVSSSQGRKARIWNVATGACDKELSHGGEVESVAFSPDGEKIVSVSHDKKVRIWNVATGACDKELSHGCEVYSVAFSWDGKKIVSGGLDGKVMIWDVATGACDKELSHGGMVYSVAFSSDGKKIASGSQDKKVRIWKKQGFDQILFIKAVVKCAKENNTEALKWLFYDAERGKLFEKKVLKDFKERVIEEYLISTEKLEVPFYSLIMRRCKKAFSKVAQQVSLLKNNVGVLSSCAR